MGLHVMSNLPIKPQGISRRETLWPQYAEYGKCTHEPFLKMLFAYTKLVALHAAALGLQRVLHLTFRGVAMIFFAKSILTSQFSHFAHPLLTVLLSHQYGEVIFEWMDWQFVCNLPRENLKFRSSKTAGNVLKTRTLLILSLSMDMHPYSGSKNRVARGACG